MSDNIQINTTTNEITLEYFYPQGPQGPAGVNFWGSLTGNLVDQIDLWSSLSAKALTVDLLSLSSDVIALETFLNLVSGTWNGGFDAFTVVSTNSANWVNAYNTAVTYQSVSGSFATNTALNAASSVLLPTSIYQNASGNWQSTFDTVNALSANWQDTYSWVNTNSANAIFESVSAISLSGIFYGDGSNLIGASLPGQADINTVVQTTSANWNSGYNAGTIYSQNSASYATNNFVNSNFFNLTGGTVSGATRINNNLTVFGNLTATGTTTFANTVFSVTSSLSVVHIGSGPALWVGNNGDGDIASFYDIDQNVEVFHIGGNNGSFPNVGVKTSTPNVDFTVNGQISANNTIWSAGGNSNNWNNAYTNQVNYLPLSGGILSDKLGIKNAPLYFDLDTASLGNSYGDLGLSSSNNILINPNSNLILTQNIGNVGIGTTTPSQKLTVIGNISASGVVSASASNISINVVNVSSDITFTNDYNNKVVHFDTTAGALRASFPSTLNSGFNVAVMNIGTNSLSLSAADLKSTGNVITTRYGGAFIYKELNNIFAVGRLV